VAVHFSPHPDDELIGAPASLMALRDAGWRIVNVPCGLGRPDQHERRKAEVREAARLARFELRFPAEPTAISLEDDRSTAEAAISEIAREAIADLRPELVVSPSPRDRHHGHEVVARAVRAALAEADKAAPRWWMWALWGSLLQPNLGIAFDEARLEEILEALAAYPGELERTDYRRVVRARAEMTASLSSELLFGFGAPVAAEVAYAEVLTEVAFAARRWVLGTPRWLDPESPLPEPSLAEAAVS
jgi:LmbE family N-acetylglucosaminyl deacetylase